MGRILNQKSAPNTRPSKNMEFSPKIFLTKFHISSLFGPFLFFPRINFCRVARNILPFLLCGKVIATKNRIYSPPPFKKHNIKVSQHPSPRSPPTHPHYRSSFTALLWRMTPPPRNKENFFLHFKLSVDIRAILFCIGIDLSSCPTVLKSRCFFFFGPPKNATPPVKLKKFGWEFCPP